MPDIQKCSKKYVIFNFDKKSWKKYRNIDVIALFLKNKCAIVREAVKNLVSMNFRLSLIRIRYVKFFCRIYVFYGVELLLLCYSITI